MAKTKAELVREVQKLGLDHVGKTGKQLAALIADATRVHEDEEVDPRLGGKAPAKSAKVVSVVDNHGEHIRSYSEKEHGEDFRALADEFASKVEGRKVVAEVEA